MSKVVSTYAQAVERADVEGISACFSNDIKVLTPGALQVMEDPTKNARLIGTAGKAISDFRAMRIYQSDDKSYLILFEGTFEGINVQIIDEVHLDENGLIHRLDLFLRPTSLAADILARIKQILNQ